MTKFLPSMLLLTALAASPAAAELAPTNRVVVRVADLDLASRSGHRLLERRLTSAIVEACGVASDADLAGSNDVRRCRDETRARVAADRQRIVELASRAAPIVLAAR